MRSETLRKEERSAEEGCSHGSKRQPGEERNAEEGEVARNALSGRQEFNSTINQENGVQFQELEQQTSFASNRQQQKLLAV